MSPFPLFLLFLSFLTSVECEIPHKINAAGQRLVDVEVVNKAGTSISVFRRVLGADDDASWFPALSGRVAVVDMLNSITVSVRAGVEVVEAFSADDVAWMDNANVRERVQGGERFFLGEVRPLLRSTFVEHGIVVVEARQRECGLDDGWTSCTARVRGVELEDEWFQRHKAECAEPAAREAWRSSEVTRLRMNALSHDQVPKWTPVGYKRITIPPTMFRDIRAFHDAYAHTASMENWDCGACYVNHATSEPPRMITMPAAVKRYIFDTMRPIVAEWIGATEPLEDVSCYGLREYRAGSMLRNHFDRTDTHAASVILAIAQDVPGDPWPLEAVGHDGVAVNVTLKPGEGLLYESASVLHGRPTVFQGNKMTNIFLHYRPRSWTADYEAIGTYRAPSPADAPHLWEPGIRYSREYEVPVAEAVGGVSLTLQQEMLKCGEANQACS
mmetsp:Transcript_12354/g.39106  ORF Transcript_12354/g.39106 Transcript_12354/m.39106 type:complete len:443 (-) Transcript_12354:57-1385(-)